MLIFMTAEEPLAEPSIEDVSDASDEVLPCPTPAARHWLSLSARYWGNLFILAHDKHPDDFSATNIVCNNVPPYGRNLLAKDPSSDESHELLWTVGTVEWYVMASVAGVVAPEARMTSKVLLAVKSSFVPVVTTNNDFPAPLPKQLRLLSEDLCDDEPESIMFRLIDRVHLERELDPATAAGMVGAVVNGIRRDNHLAVLTLAWSYILSALWAEMQGGSIEYSGSKAPFIAITSPQMSEVAAREGIVYVAQSSEAVEWWRSLLSPGSGWEAVITRYDEHYTSPWAVRLPSGFSNFDVVSPLPMESQLPHAPDARTALQFLAHYCGSHGLFSQAKRAFHAALVLPTHFSCHIQINLPKPCHIVDLLCAIDPTRDDHRVLQLMANVPQLMTISARTIVPLLHTAFYNPDVPCDHSGEWLAPVLHSLPPRTTDFAVMCCLRSPSQAPWFIGAGVTSFASRKSFRRFLIGGMWPTSLDLAAWTGTSHSYWCSLLTQDTALHISGKHPQVVRRDEEALVLILTSGGGYDNKLLGTPDEPWRPPGFADFAKSSLGVIRVGEARAHLRLVYNRWEWGISHSGEGGVGGNVDALLSHLSLEDASARSLWPTKIFFGWLQETRGIEADHALQNFDFTALFDDDSDVLSNAKDHFSSNSRLDAFVQDVEACNHENISHNSSDIGVQTDQ